MAKPNSSLVGAAGEHYVLSQLLRRGWIAALAPTGAPNMDIVVTDEQSKRLCAIQVKSRRHVGSDNGWHMRPKHESLFQEDLFYVFVDMGKAPSDAETCFILPSKIVANTIQRQHTLWLATPGKDGRKRKDSDVRRFLPDYSRLVGRDSQEGKEFLEHHGSCWLEPYRGNWGVLRLPPAEGF